LLAEIAKTGQEGKEEQQWQSVTMANHTGGDR